MIAYVRHDILEKIVENRVKDGYAYKASVVRKRLVAAANVLQGQFSPVYPALQTVAFLRQRG